MYMYNIIHVHSSVICLHCTYMCNLLCLHVHVHVCLILQISQAVVPIVLWIAALVDYRKAKSTVQPYRDQLNEAEETLTCANEVYVTMRHDMLATKDDLEAQHLKHKEAVKSCKTAKTAVQVHCTHRVHIA